MIWRYLYLKIGMVRAGLVLKSSGLIVLSGLQFLRALSRVFNAARSGVPGIKSRWKPRNFWVELLLTGIYLSLIVGFVRSSGTAAAILWRLALLVGLAVVIAVVRRVAKWDA